MRQHIQEIKKIAIETFVMDKDSIHGVHHWDEVHDNGVMLAQQPGVDVLVVRLFAYLHDCKREDDHQDPEHGDRSADFCSSLRMKGDLDFLTSDQFTKLWTACKLHHTGSVTEDPTVGACFDADRMELIRCGITPRVDLMNTPMGKRIAQKMNDLREFKGRTIIEEKILKLKELENARQIALGWFYKEEFTEEEYLLRIGEYKNLEPIEIVNLILKLIREM